VIITIDGLDGDIISCVYIYKYIYCKCIHRHTHTQRLIRTIKVRTCVITIDSLDGLDDDITCAYTYNYIVNVFIDDINILRAKNQT